MHKARCEVKDNDKVKETRLKVKATGLKRETITDLVLKSALRGLRFRLVAHGE